MHKDIHRNHTMVWRESVHKLVKMYSRTHHPIEVIWSEEAPVGIIFTEYGATVGLPALQDYIDLAKMRDNAAV